MHFRTAILFVGSALVGGLVFLLTASLSYHYLFTPHAPKIIVVANNNNNSGGDNSSSSSLAVSSVCDIPTDLEDSIAWLASMATRRIIGPTICQPAIPSPNPNRPPPVVMTFNRSTRMDELRRVQWTDQEEELQPKCQYAAIHYAGDNRVKLGDGNGEEKVWKDLPPVLTRNQLPARAADGGTRFAYVRCWQPVKDKEEEEVEAREVIFEDLFIFMPSLEKFEKRRRKEAKEAQHQQPVSVLILVLESTSRANFHRSMPQTAAALHQLTGSVFYLKGLTRIGDNTLENMLPFTTGLRVSDLGKDKDKAKDHKDHKNHKDHQDHKVKAIDLNRLPMLWAAFEAAGYATAFLDDNPPARSMLSWGPGSGGFARPPTTFFAQPFWTVANKGADLMGDCVFNGSRSPAAELLGQTERFIRYVQQEEEEASQVVPFFALSMLIRTLHNGWFNAGRVDAVYADFLRRLGPTLLAEAVLVMMGDHGDRYSPESSLLESGQVEGNLPLMAIRLPPRLLRRRPEWGDALLRNRRRLTSNLDVHRTLLEMLRAEMEGEKEGKRKESFLAPFRNNPNFCFLFVAQPLVTPSTNSRHSTTPTAYSLVSEEVPLNRSCEEAGIAELYCVCRMSHRVELLPADRPTSELFAGLIANFTAGLNAMLPPERCQRLSVRRVLSMAVFLDSPPLNTSSSSSWWITDRLLSFLQPSRQEVVEFTVEMAPSGAVLRTRMVRSPVSGWSAIDAAHPVERLNMYGGQSHCLAEEEEESARVLRKYCLCWDVKGEEEEEEEEEGKSSTTTSTTSSA